MHPLAAITVVSFEQAVAAPLATRHLADLGARVIKVERPGGGDFARSYGHSVRGQSSYFVWLNRGKESIELNLKAPDDRALLDRVLTAADVVVQNLVPGAAERLGLDAATLRGARPELVHCSIAGYSGSDKKAYDLLIQAEAGVLAVTGTPEQPSKAGISVADIATGVYAYSGILAALYERERTGIGATLSVSLLDALGEWMTQPVYEAVYGGAEPRRTGARHATIAPYGPYATRDGTVYLGVQNDREWAVLCREVLERPELVERYPHNPDRIAHDDALTEIIEQAFADRDVEEVLATLEQAGIACARLRTPGEVFEHPQLQWRRVDTPGGPVSALAPPVRIGGREPLMRAVPGLGEHNDAIREEFA